MTAFAPAPDHAAQAEAAGVAVWRVERAEELEAALAEAAATIRRERRPCLIALKVAPE
ncbi:MAG: thiamine pyrophosphate-dependent enzyme [Pseudomonadota bacterium]